MTPWRYVFGSTDSSKLVHHLGVLALLVGSSVLMNETVGSSLVQLLDSGGVSGGGSSLVALGDSSLELLHRGAELGASHLVLQGLGLNDLDALLGGFDIRQSVHLP